MDATVEIVVTGHNIAEADRYRKHVAAKLARLDHLSHNVTRYEVELDHEPNPRQAKSSERVVITSHGTEPALRAESHGVDLFAALDDAVSKLEGQLRRRHDRRVRRPRGGHPTAEPGPA